MLSKAQSLHGRTLNKGRYQRLVHSSTASDFGQTSTYADGVIFDGRLESFQSEEADESVLVDKRQLYTLNAAAGLSLGLRDRVRDTVTGDVYELIKDFRDLPASSQIGSRYVVSLKPEGTA